MSARVLLSLAAASVIALAASSGPLHAQSSAPPAAGTQPATPPMHGNMMRDGRMMQDGQGHMSNGHMRRGMSPAVAVERRIQELHRQLKITPEQETAWGAVAQVMRDDVKAVDAVAAERQKDLPAMSALDNLRSFQRLAQTHAEGLTKLADAFAPLYAAMSDDQKKNADGVFRYEGRHGRGHMGSRP